VPRHPDQTDLEDLLPPRDIPISVVVTKDDRMVMQALQIQVPLTVYDAATRHHGPVLKARLTTAIQRALSTKETTHD
jgi:hypothetical protein